MNVVPRPAMTSEHEVLVELIGRIDAVDDECFFEVGPAPETDGWRSLSQLVDDAGTVDALLGALLDGEAAGQRDVAGSYLASWLAGPIAQLMAAAWLEDGRILHLVLDQVSIRFHEDGWVDGVGITDAGLTVGARDSAIAVPGVQVIADIGERRRLVVGQIRGVAAPIFDAVRALVPYGRSGMWGSLADGLAGSTLYTEQRRPGGGDPAAAWAGVDALLDELACQIPELRTRPRRQVIPRSGGSRHQAIRGTCCLYYKTRVEPDPCGDGYCSSCPHRPDESRAERISRWLEDQRT